MMRCAVIDELDIHTAGRKRCAIDLNIADASRNLLWILDNDLVARGVITECDFKAPPSARDTRIEIEPRAS